MSTATAPPPPTQSPKAAEPEPAYNPDSFRMTVGEHLEELRWRLILALIGFAVALAICLTLGERFMEFFCAPLINALQAEDLSTVMNYTKVTEPFMVYLEMSMIGGAVIAGPWMIYQIWQFVAAGLYPHERKTVTRYIPLSVTLFLTGVVFVYVLVLPLTMRFFLQFSNSIVLPGHRTSPTLPITEAMQTKVLQLPGNIANPIEGSIWFNNVDGRLYFFIGHKARIIQFGASQLLTPHLTISDYIDLVITFMLTFGIAFQLPLVVLALVRIGVVEIDFLRKQRKMIYFVMAVASAFIAPGDVVTSMLALLIPLMILYEFGLWLAARQLKRLAEESAESP
jgi:sec-independent protein translocase protein TatC